MKAATNIVTKHMISARTKEFGTHILTLAKWPYTLTADKAATWESCTVLVESGNFQKIIEPPAGMWYDGTVHVALLPILFTYPDHDLS